MSQHSNQLPTQPTSNLTAEWQIKSLKDVADFANGKPYEGHIDADGRYALITLDSVDIKGRLKDSHRMTNVWDESLQAGDIVSVLSDLAHGLLLGMSAVIPADGTYVLNQRMGRLRLKVPGNSDFVRLQINARQEHFRKRGQGTSQRHIYKRDFESLEIPFPAPKEQDTIATALSDVDALIAGLERLIAKKRDIKQAAMQQLLTGQTRLPGFSGEWRAQTLFELAERKKELFDDGDWIEAQHIRSEGIRLIQTGNIGIGQFLEKQEKKFIDEKSFAMLKCKELKVGDLLICRLADPAGRACVLPFIDEARVVTSVDVTIFRPPVDSINRAFLSQVFSMPDWFKKVSDRSGGTTHKRIARGALGRIEINVPSHAEQTAIATVLSDMDADLTALESRLAKTRAIKQGMMQELLTGRTRLLCVMEPA